AAFRLSTPIDACAGWYSVSAIQPAKNALATDFVSVWAIDLAIAYLVKQSTMTSMYLLPRGVEPLAPQSAGI
ncbi:hypothetical protein ACTXT7_016671, partial [Hymenolepis weldensis]